VTYVFIGFVVLWAFSRHMNVLALGEKQAIHMGMSLSWVRWTVLIAASLIAAAAVSVSGTIGFVGLVIPHMVRRLFGEDYRWILPYSALGGAIFMVACDTLARTLLEPRELPIGVITAFVGGLFLDICSGADDN
jgi:iron complex transport system permease protein